MPLFPSLQSLRKIMASASLLLAASVAAGASADVDGKYLSLPAYSGSDLELTVDATGTHFRLWSPEAQGARVMLYPTGRGTAATDTLEMARSEGGTWTASVPRRLYGQFYTFQVRHDGRWLAETPGVWAKAVGVNGQRAAIVDLSSTNPEGWDKDRGPALAAPTDAVIYEMHHRDFTAHPSSGVVNKGKFLALTEPGTTSPQGLSTGIDHLRDLGVTHVHILPSYDFNSVDEANLQQPQYNWGYDPQNYNAPEGSYSTNPADPAARIAEFKRMVQALHQAGIGVVMDVVYNHTAENDGSNFSLTAPGAYYRHRPDGTYSDASGCGNETASERPQVSDYIVNSVKYWADEYHVDGFRFDLMAIHDTATMNRVARTLRAERPDILIYGEGWTAGDSPLPVGQRALKENVAALDGIAVFSDDLRDAVKGHYTDGAARGFATGAPGMDETVMIGIVGATGHPQVDYAKGNNSKFPYSPSPAQVVNYVSCHDDMSLTDKLAKSMPGSTEQERQRAARLAQTIVLTSQGIPFVFAGEEVFRDKKGVHNSYKSPDSINAIDWNLRAANADQFDYYKGLIALRKAHPAFRLRTAQDVASHLKFDRSKAIPEGVISYALTGNAGGDAWRDIRVVLNGTDQPQTVPVPKGQWQVIAEDGRISPDGGVTPLGTSKGGKVTVPGTSALILARE